MMPKSLNDFCSRIHNKYGVIISIDYSYDNDNTIDLHYIIVPRKLRSQGLGTIVMNELCSFADKHQVNIELIAQGIGDDSFFTTVRLVKFYSRFNFIPTHQGTMTRLPKLHKTRSHDNMVS